MKCIYCIFSFFLLLYAQIESLKTRGNAYLSVDNVRKIATLSKSRHLFSGTNSNFMTHVTLERGKAVGGGDKALAGIDEAAVGDVLVHYLDQVGQVAQGYICDYGWNQDAARAVCNSLGYQDGIPTYDGKYGKKDSTSGAFALSKLQCPEGSEGINDECTFRSKYSSRGYLIQERAMQQFGGKGYACRPGDNAGVICGATGNMAALLNSDTDCDGSEKSVGEVFELKKQIGKVTAKLNSDRHWAEYLLPMPMAVSLLTSVMLQSGQFSRTVVLVKPENHDIKYMKWDTVQPNLMVFADSVTRAFKVSYSSMRSVGMNSEDIHKYLLKSLNNARSSNKFERDVLFKFHLNKVESSANESFVQAQEAYNAYSHTEEVLEELVQMLIATERARGREVNLLESELVYLRNITQRLETEVTNSTKNKEELRANIETLLNDFHKAAKEALEEECINGDTVCNKCVYHKEEKQEECEVEKVNQCVQFKDICTSEGSTGGYFGSGIGSKKYCAVRQVKCVKCQLVCPKYKYIQAGRYCADDGRERALCGRCTYATEMSGAIGRIMELSASTLSEGSSVGQEAPMLKYMEVILGILESLVADVNTWRQTVGVEIPSNGTTALSDEESPLTDFPADSETEVLDRSKRSLEAVLGTISTLAQNNRRQDRQIVIPPSESTSDICPQAHRRSKRDAGDEMDTGRSLVTRLNLLRTEVALAMVLLPQEKDRDETDAQVAQWLQGTQNTVLKMKEEEQITSGTVDAETFSSLSSALTQGAKLHKAFEEKAEVAAKQVTKLTDTKGTPIPAIVGREAHALILNEREYVRVVHRLDKAADALQGYMSDILRADVKQYSLNQIIKFLKDIVRYLGSMKKHWGQLTLFFKNLRGFIKYGNEQIQGMIQLQRSLEGDSQDEFLAYFEDELVAFLAHNAYTNR